MIFSGGVLFPFLGLLHDTTEALVESVVLFNFCHPSPGKQFYSL